MSYTYRYPRPAVTVDSVVFDGEQDCSVLLIRRKNEPFRDDWALPGGFFDMEDESTATAVARELEEETGLAGVEMRLFGAFSASDRDPRGRTISLAYVGTVSASEVEPIAADDAKDVRWFKLGELPRLAFDHEQVIEAAVQALKSDPRR